MHQRRSGRADRGRGDCRPCVVSLRISALRPGYLSLTLPVGEVKPAIEGHAEFQAFTKAAGDTFAAWRTRTDITARAFGTGGHPKEFIEAISEDLLGAFRKAPLVDPYDIYQHLMDYWAEAMQDDAYLIAAAGWVAGAHHAKSSSVRTRKASWFGPSQATIRSASADSHPTLCRHA